MLPKYPKRGRSLPRCRRKRFRRWGQNLHGRSPYRIVGWTDFAGMGAKARLLAVAAIAAAALGGCANVSEQTAASAFVAPGKFDLYTCQDIERRVATTRNRQIELEQLMARSAQAPGGEFINTLVYRSEHLQARGELDLLAKAATERQCATKSQWSSGRAVF